LVGAVGARRVAYLQASFLSTAPSARNRCGVAAFRRARLTGPNDEDGATCAVRNALADAAKRGDPAKAPAPDD
jgi:hypothetical protein